MLNKNTYVALIIKNKRVPPRRVLIFYSKRKRNYILKPLKVTIKVFNLYILKLFKIALRKQSTKRTYQEGTDGCIRRFRKLDIAEF